MGSSACLDENAPRNVAVGGLGFRTTMEFDARLAGPTMKQSFTRVMLICIITAARVSADSLDAGLGVDRSSLSPEQIAARSARLEASTSFSLLRFSEALHAPARIFEPSIWRAIQ